MRYITDEHKNITHVVVPIDEWNSMLEKRGAEDDSINPYQPVIAWLEDELKKHAPDGKVPSLINLSSAIQGEERYVPLPVYNMLRTILDNKHIAGNNSSVQRFGGLTSLLSLMYTFALSADSKTIAIAYILRNNEFYSTLHNTETDIDSKDESVLAGYGFNITKFKREGEPELLTTLYSGHKSEFVFKAINSGIADYFQLQPIKERVRRDPEALRLFFYDLFDALDEILAKEPEYTEIFKKYPLVDRLAKAVYPNNTLSGSTSRVYKAAKEARQIIVKDWQKYVSVAL